LKALFKHGFKGELQNELEKELIKKKDGMFSSWLGFLIWRVNLTLKLSEA
jgi:hypothetical protein